jgi:hypothetical protein
VAGRDKLAAFYERRFRPEYATAFAAWWNLNPMNNPSVPPGPIFMAEYRNANGGESVRFTEEAKEHFEKGAGTRQTGDKYVKVTVLLATVLLLTALSQRFEIFGPRVAVMAVALCAAAHGHVLDIDPSAGLGRPCLPSDQSPRAVISASRAIDLWRSSLGIGHGEGKEL